MHKNGSSRDSSLRNSVLSFCLERYGTQPEYPWIDEPGYAVLRHYDNKKWYALIMDVPYARLGLDGGIADKTDILNLKCDPVLIGSLLTEKGFCRAYHMNKNKWITVLLDGSVRKEQIYSLIRISYDLTASKIRLKNKPLTPMWDGSQE